MQPAEVEAQRTEVNSLRAQLLEMQQSYDESQRTIAELQAHTASLQSDKQQAQETLGLEKLKRESLKAKLLEMQQSYDESQRTVAELQAHTASLQSDRQQAQETLGLEKLKLSEAAKARETAEVQHKSTLYERDAVFAKEQSNCTAKANTQPAEESRWDSSSGSTCNWPGVNAKLQKALDLPIWKELLEGKKQAKQNLENIQRVHDEWMPQLEAERIKRIEDHEKQEQEHLKFKADQGLRRQKIKQTSARHMAELARFERAFARRQKDQAKSPSASVKSPSNAEVQANEGDSTGPEGSALDLERKEQHQPTAVTRQGEAVDDDRISQE